MALRTETESWKYTKIEKQRIKNKIRKYGNLNMYTLSWNREGVSGNEIRTHHFMCFTTRERNNWKPDGRLVPVV